MRGAWWLVCVGRVHRTKCQSHVTGSFAPNRSWRIDQIQQGISHTVLVGHVN